MKILIIGGSGMIGSSFYQAWKDKHQVMATLKNDFFEYKKLNHIRKKDFFCNIDVLKDGLIEKVVKDFQPEAVINCIGITKQLIDKKDYDEVMFINSKFPFILKKICNEYDAKLIHLSTDCVFSGKKGNYTENDIADADDLYGTSKKKGEIHDCKKTITFRKSTIGLEVEHKHGLLEWFLEQEKEVYGFKHAIFSGLSTYELSRVVENVITKFPSLWGLFHISGESINKYDLLNKFNKAMLGNKIKIKEDTNFNCDRSLNAARFNDITGYNPPSWDKMIFDLNEELKIRNDIKK